MEILNGQRIVEAIHLPQTVGIAGSDDLTRVFRFGYEPIHVVAGGQVDDNEYDNGDGDHCREHVKDTFNNILEHERMSILKVVFNNWRGIPTRSDTPRLLTSAYFLAKLGSM